MALHSAPRLGVVVPSGNAAAEPEIGSLVSPALNVHTSRFPVLPGKDLRGRLEKYNDVLPDVLGTSADCASTRPSSPAPGPTTC